MAAAKRGNGSLQQLIAKYSLAFDSERNKVRCKLTGHEMPARQDIILQYVSGKSYKLAATRATDQLLAKYAPHFVPDRKIIAPGDSSNKVTRIFCNLTGRLIRNEMSQLEKHVSGRRFLRELLNWQQAKERNEAYVPTWKRERNRRNRALTRANDVDSDEEEEGADVDEQFYTEFGYDDEEEEDEDEDDEEEDEDEEEDSEEGQEGENVEIDESDEEEHDSASASEDGRDDVKSGQHTRINGRNKRAANGSNGHGGPVKKFRSNRFHKGGKR